MDIVTSTENATAQGTEQLEPQQSSSAPQPPELKYDLVELRRGKVLRLLSTGLSQSEIAGALGVHKSTISRDVLEMKKEAQQDIQRYIQETLPFEHAKVLALYDEIVRQAWLTYTKTEDHRIGLQALSLILTAAEKRLDALGDVEYLNQANEAIVNLKRQLGIAVETGTQ